MDIIEESRVTLQIVASLTIIIYDRNMLIVKATEQYYIDPIANLVPYSQHATFFVTYESDQ
jgi:hypothetical protein